MKLLPQLVQHMNTRLVLGNPKDELRALRGRENALHSRKSREEVGSSIKIWLRGVNLV